MAQIDILKEVLDYSLRKFDYNIIGSSIYYLFNNERYAKAELKRIPNKNVFDGITITYISKLSGEIDHCDISFKDVFKHSKRATINIDLDADEYKWFESQHPTPTDLYQLAEHVERYINIIGDFGNNFVDYLGMPAVASSMVTLSSMQGINGSPNGIPGSSNVLSFNSFDELKADEAKQDIDFIKDEFSTESLDEIVDNEEFKDTLIDNFEFNEDVHETVILEEELDEVIVDSDIKSGIIDLEEDLNDVDVKDFDVKESIVQIDDCETIEQDAKELEENIISEDVTFDKTNVDEKDEKEKKSENSKKGFFGLFKSKDKKDINKNLVSIKDKSDNREERNEEIHGKPFVTWNIGADGDNIIASLYEIEKNLYHLEMKGKGNMQDFKALPWNKYVDNISTVEIKEGIVNIGNNAFKSFSLITEITLPNSIKYIGFSSFEFCTNLEKVIWSNNLKIIGDFAFAGDENLKEIKLPASVVQIKDYAFEISNDFKIICNDPDKIKLGAGISVSDIITESSAAI